MRTSKYLLATLREVPNDAEIISHKLMLRAGMVRKLASGLYNWLPTGLRVLKKVERIVREEMEHVGAIECLMPAVQPGELWQESGRWAEYGPELLRFKDRHQRAFCLGPTHEEIITDLVRDEVRSYKQLPLILFQIQNKFRDEIRPRFGVMRAREFLMKDAYSFHLSDKSLDQTYQDMYQAYGRIFQRLGLDYRAVIADTGSIGGSASHEFHVLAQSGEDAIAFSDTGDYAANIEKAQAVASPVERKAPAEAMTEVATPDAHSVAEVSAVLGVPPESIIKTLLVRGTNEAGEAEGLVALLLRGDYELNEIKASHLPGLLSPLEMASDAEIRKVLNCGTGSIGPVGLELPILADHSVMNCSDFVCGANKDGYHLTGVNWGRDLNDIETIDIRNVVDGDASPDGDGRLQIKRGIEVGHIFQLGRKYSQAMKANVLGEDGRATTLTMGCYGIGISRVVAAAIEQNHDDKGIVWPDALAPFQVVILPMNMHRSYRVREATEALYNALLGHGIEVLLDDRKERPGVMFNDMDLLGVPHRVVIGERALDRQEVEYQSRRSGETQAIPAQDIESFILRQLEGAA